MVKLIYAYDILFVTHSHTEVTLVCWSGDIILFYYRVQYYIDKVTDFYFLERYGVILEFVGEYWGVTNSPYFYIFI
jgi:hypothetical protein